jgi:hypothetical protein
MIDALFRKLAVVLVVCAPVAVGCTAGEATTPEPPPPVERPAFDVTDLAALQSTWWTWAASAPPERNPVMDTTGEHCDQDQPDGVWLVAGSFGDTVERRCSVPVGVPLAGPAVNLVGNVPADCADFMRDADGAVTMDGAEVPLREANVEISFRGVEGNPVTSTGGEFDGYGCGLWFAIPDLEPGEHVLEIQGGSADFALSVTYHLTVSAAV